MFELVMTLLGMADIPGAGGGDTPIDVTGG